MEYVLISISLYLLIFVFIWKLILDYRFKRLQRGLFLLLAGQTIYGIYFITSSMFTSTTVITITTIVIAGVVGIVAGLIAMMSYAPSVSGPSEKVTGIHKETEAQRIQFVKMLLDKGTVATNEEMTTLLDISINYLASMEGGTSESERPASVALFYSDWESLLKAKIISSDRIVRDPAMVRENLAGKPLIEYVQNNGGYEYYFSNFVPELTTILKKYSSPQNKTAKK